MMNSPSFRFLASIAVLTAACAVAQWQWDMRASANMHSADGFLLLGVFAVVSGAVHLFLLRSAKNSGAVFVRNFMAVTSLKFFFYLGVLVVLLVFGNDNKEALIVHFLVYYALFTVFEAGMLYAQINKRKG